MEGNVWKIVIGSIGVIAGALITALASAYAARQKIRELEVSYEQKLRENYLTNARQYTISVYVPLSIAVLKLFEQYQLLKDSLEIKSPSATITEQAFRQACKEYENSVSSLFERGAAAYLTSQLEQQLQSFNRFLDASLVASEAVLLRDVEYHVYIPGFVRLRGRHSFKSDRGPIQRAFTSLWGSRRFRINFVPGTSLSYHMPKLLCAPITSPEFDERMVADIQVIKFLIKEVTLGSHSVDSITAA
jgi:hypothetical protein